MRRFRKGFIVFLFFVVLIVVTLGAAYFFYTDSLKAVSDDVQMVEYEILPDTTVDSLTRDLQREGLIKNGFITKFVAQREGLTDIKAGLFNVSPSMTPSEIMAVFNDSSNIIQNTYTMQFIDGQWAKDYASVISQNTDYTAIEVLSLWNDETFVTQLIADYEVLTDSILVPEVNVLLEGYFSPNTYEFFREATIEEITRTLIEPTNEFYLINKELFDNSNLTIHENFILASMVQFEASHIEDQHLVASTYINRFGFGQRFESSVPLCYAFYDFSGWEECENNPGIASPYNTYLYDGLPIGPVSNSTHTALLAVLQPIESPYFYFVADVYGDGKVYFSETYEEHLQLVEQYLGGRY